MTRYNIYIKLKLCINDIYVNYVLNEVHLVEGLAGEARQVDEVELGAVLLI